MPHDAAASRSTQYIRNAADTLAQVQDVLSKLEIVHTPRDAGQNADLLVQVCIAQVLMSVACALDEQTQALVGAIGRVR